MRFSVLLAAALSAALASPAIGQSRYATPKPTSLSSDLASPWILQLRSKPNAGSGYAVEIARPRAAQVRNPAIGAPPRSASGWQVRSSASSFSPLSADPVRRNRQAVSASLGQPQPVREEPRQEKKAQRGFDP